MIRPESVSRVHPVILIVGSTGVGKSELALRASEKFTGVIMNCDSVQTYQRLDIGAAKPTPEERARVPHFLFDIIPPGGHLTAGDFRRLALEVLAREIPQHNVFAVGGSGFYIQALEKGMFEADKPNPEVERQVREDFTSKGLAVLWKELEQKDPEYAEDINPNDSYRIIRALVVLRERGVKVSDLRKQFKPQPFPYPLIKMGLECPREKLKERIERRTRQMLERGLMNEVKELVKEGWADWPPLHSVGYHECLQVLQGEIPEARLEAQIVEKTMQLAKKQMTWFRRDQAIRWFSTEQGLEPALEWLSESLSLSKN